MSSGMIVVSMLELGKYSFTLICDDFWIVSFRIAFQILICVMDIQIATFYFSDASSKERITGENIIYRPQNVS